MTTSQPLPSLELLAQVVHRIEQRIAQRAAAAMTDEEYAKVHEKEMTERLLAAAAGLPRVCIYKKCRRRNRCFGNWRTQRSHDIHCLHHHHGLMKKRFRSALKVLGWPNRNDDGTPICR